jgi:hypothetical protein
MESPESMQGWLSHPYFVDIILADEKNFLISPAYSHAKMLADGTVQGDRKVMIEDGKAVVDYEDGLKAWKEWEARTATSGPQ